MAANRKIKVAEVITRMDRGGAPDIVRNICSNLDPECYDVLLVTGPTPNPTERTKEFLNKFGNRVTVIPRLKREINPINDIPALVMLYLFFRREKFDVVHTHTAKAGVLARVAASFAGCQAIIHTPHGHNFYGYFGPCLSRIIIAMERFVARWTDKILVFTELEKKDFIKFKVADDEKICLIYQGLELDRYLNANIDKVKVKKSFGIKPDEEVVGMIGRLEPIKGTGCFIEAAEEVRKKFPRTKFIIVGEGSLRPKLENQVKRAALEERFIFTGWREDTPEVLSILDILVLPSLNEAVGIVLIEAQASGVPVVATNVGGIPEVVQENETGLLVPPEDYVTLAGAISYLLGNKQKRLEMGKAGRLWVKDRFKIRDMADKISALYKELACRKPA